MKIVIAGSNGFAQYLAHYLETTTAHQFVILSRRAQPALTVKGWHIIQTDYTSIPDLTYLLTGVDVVFSTITGNSQLSLIDAAAAANIRTFVPSEYRESPSTQPLVDSSLTTPSAYSSTTTLERLQLHATQTGMNYTIFTCGLFYEHFAPGGLASSQIDVTRRLGNEGDFLVDIRGCRATIPSLDPSPTSTQTPSPSPFNPIPTSTTPTPDPEIYITLTSARDAARHITASLSLPTWPRQLTFHTERLSLPSLIAICSRVRGLPFQIQTYTASAIRRRRDDAVTAHDEREEKRMTALLQTLNGQYDSPSTNLSGEMVGVQCEGFEECLTSAWAGVLKA